MKNRADLDHEIDQENRAIMHIERQIEPERWRWLSPQEKEKRAAGIMEKWEMGWSREAIAKHYDLSRQRVSQIVNSFGAGWR